MSGIRLRGGSLARLRIPTDNYRPGGLVVALEPDGRSLATAIRGRTAKSTIQVLELPSGQPHRTIDGGPGEISALAFSPEGTRLAAVTSVGGKTDLRVWPLGTRAPPWSPGALWVSRSVWPLTPEGRGSPSGS